MTDNLTTIENLIFRQIDIICSLSGHEGKIGIVVGSAGCGKTVALTHYAKRHENAYFAIMDDTMCYSGILRAIGESMGLSFCHSIPVMSASIVRKLMESKSLLILDEARLKAEFLDRLRLTICVRAKTPLILAGSRDILTTISRARAAGKLFLDQFWSRIISIIDLDQLETINAGPDGLYTADDIRKLFVYGGVDLSPDAVALLRQIARTPHSGRLRTCATIIQALHMAAAVQEGGLITAALIRAAIEELRIPLPTGIYANKAEEVATVAAAAG